MNIYSNYPVKYSLEITMLYLALLFAFIFAIVAIYEYLNIKWMEEHLGGTRSLWSSTIFWVYVMMIVIAVLAFLNAVAGVLKLKVTFLIFGFLALVALFVTLVLAGMLLHDFREQTEAPSYQFGKEILDRTHSQWAADTYCPQKYVSNGGCEKSDFRTQWEGSNGLKPLNSDCFLRAARWYHYRYFRFCYFVMLCLIFLFMAAAANFFLTDENHKLVLNPVVFAVIGLMLLFAIAMGCWFIWGYDHTDNFKYDSYHDNKNANFRPVPEALQTQQFVRDNCADFGDMGLWNLETDGYYRVAVLGQGFSFGSLSGVNEGSAESRKFFFNDENSENDYKLLYGKKSQVQNALNQMDVCLTHMSGRNRIYLRAEKLNDASVIDSNGLKSSENPGSLNLSPSGSNFNGAWGYKYDLTCSPLCEQLY